MSQQQNTTVLNGPAGDVTMAFKDATSAQDVVRHCLGTVNQLNENWRLKWNQKVIFDYCYDLTENWLLAPRITRTNLQ